MSSSARARALSISSNVTSLPLSGLLEMEEEKVEIFDDDGDGLDWLVLAILFCRIIGFRMLAGGGLDSVSGSFLLDAEFVELALLIPVSMLLLTNAERNERTMIGPKRHGTIKFFSRIRLSSLHFITISWQQRAWRIKRHKLDSIGCSLGKSMRKFDLALLSMASPMQFIRILNFLLSCERLARVLERGPMKETTLRTSS